MSHANSSIIHATDITSVTHMLLFAYNSHTKFIKEIQLSFLHFYHDDLEKYIKFIKMCIEVKLNRGDIPYSSCTVGTIPLQ